MNISYNKNQEVIAVITCLAMVFIMLFSSLYVIIQADHDCIGENCTVCMSIHKCEDNLRLISFGLSFGGISVSGLLFFLKASAVTIFYILRLSPVDKRVRMNN